MPQEFLSEFLRTLSATETQQIFNILSKLRDKGEIRTPQEFQKKLSELAELIQENDITLHTPYLTFDARQILESDAIRTFIEGALLDAESALSQTELLGNTARAHNKILTENHFDALEAALDELDSRVRAYEVLTARKYTGFSHQYQTYSFSGAISAIGAESSDPLASSLLTDSRSRDETRYCFPRVGESGLHLPINKDTIERTHFFDSIEILTDSSTPQGEISLATLDNIPVRAIDGNRDTAWKHSVLLREHPDVCRLKVGLSFAHAKRVNAIVIDSLSDVAMELVSGSYLDVGGQETDIEIGSSSSKSRSDLLGSKTLGKDFWQLRNKKTIIPVGDFVAKKITLVFQQNTGLQAEFFYDADLRAWEKGESFEEMSSLVEPVRDLQQELGLEEPPPVGADPDDFSSPFTSVEGIFMSNLRRRAKFYEYVFGFREVSVIEREYFSDGIFVAEPFTIKAPNTLAIHTAIDLPSGESTGVEISVAKENYDVFGRLIDSEVFPVVPYGDDEIDERIVLNQNQNSLVFFDTGVTRFYPDFSSSFSVYEGTTELTIGSDYNISINEGSTWLTSLPSGSSTSIKSCLIRITSPQPSGLYHVLYTPLVSSDTAGGEVFINDSKTIRLDKYQTYVFDNSRISDTVDSCKIGVQVALRANTSNTRVSPYLSEIVILGD